MPNNWKTYKLSEVTTKIGSGATPRGGQEAYKSSGISLIRSQNVLDFTFSTNGLVFIDEEQASKLNNVTIEENDILLNITGDSVARVCKVPSEYLPARVNQHVAIVRADSSILNSEFLKYSLLEKTNKDKLLTLASAGATRNAITKSMIESFEIVLPNLQEQKSIASILSTIDDKIENNLAINKTLEEMAMTLYKHWFVDFGPFQDGEFVESELGRIPKGWEVKDLGSIVSVLGGYAFKSAWFQDSGVKVLKIKNINNNIVDINNCTCISEEISKNINPKFRVTKGDFLIAMTGAEVGKVGAVPDYNQELWLNQRVGKLVDKELKNASILIGKLLQTNDFYKIMQGLAYGSAQPNISTSDIESIKIALPIDKSILNEIIDEFVNSHEIIIQNLTENQTLTQLRDTLLPKLISGEVRLKEFREESITN